MDAIDRLLDRIGSALLFLAGLTIVVMMLHITADVIGKMFFNHPIIGTLEIVSVVYMIGTVYLTLPHVQSTRGHILVELFTQKMSEGGKFRLDTFCTVLTAIYVTLIAWMGGITALHKTDIGESQDATFFELPVWPSRWVLVIGMGVTALIAIAQVIGDGKRIARGEGPKRIGDHSI